MRHWYFLLFCFCSTAAIATQQPLGKNGLPLQGPPTLPAKFCEVRAKMASEFFDEEKMLIDGLIRTEVRVGWNMTLLEVKSGATGKCPTRDFQVIIRGAHHARDDEGRDHYVYRDDLPQPDYEPKDFRLTQMQVRYGKGGKLHDEWRILP